MRIMQIHEWSTLDEAARARVLSRPGLADVDARRDDVAAIVKSIRADGDAALRDCTRRLDGVDLANPFVDSATLDAAAGELNPATRAAIDRAFETIAAFHRPSALRSYTVDTAPGVRCRRLARPLAAVGLYVPGGSAPLVSTALMLGVPARLAACPTIVLATPPDGNGRVAAGIRYAARRCGIDIVLRAGGAQAIAAMGYGTENVPRVDKLFGPGNAWVTEAKRQVAEDPAGAGADMPAGPSELLVVADAAADPGFVAADLLSQAEHGPDSQVLLVTASPRLAREVRAEIARQLAKLPRRRIAERALAAGCILRVPDLAAGVQIVNRYAPEHLILNVADPETLLPRVQNAGSVFLGPWAAEAMGDYISGTNHVLPTAGHASQRGGLTVADFQKSLTVQTMTAAGLAALGPAASTLARIEGLEAHARAVNQRLDAYEETA